MSALRGPALGLADLKYILGRSGYRYFVTTESCSSVRLEHHTDNVGVGSSNLPGTTIDSPTEETRSKSCGKGSIPLPPTSPLP